MKSAVDGDLPFPKQSSRHVPLLRISREQLSRLVDGQRIEIPDVRFGDEVRRVEIELATPVRFQPGPPDPPQARELVFHRKDFE